MADSKFAKTGSGYDNMLINEKAQFALSLAKQRTGVDITLVVASKMAQLRKLPTHVFCIPTYIYVYLYIYIYIYR